ncbi:hypothetical protein OUZ56_021961 [Daphnia magna]|uniref:Uncharacterized protein n=1 Tax=Daphnia magna TaxID=35525 RepID=A0ABR0AV04_9CRUS|nr:hypothetical protein OUZ56_021961 [Daphnia magna]
MIRDEPLSRSLNVLLPLAQQFASAPRYMRRFIRVSPGVHPRVSRPLTRRPFGPFCGQEFAPNELIDAQPPHASSIRQVCVHNQRTRTSLGNNNQKD